MKSHIPDNKMFDEIDRAADMYEPLMTLLSDPEFAAAEKSAEKLAENPETEASELMKARLKAYSVAMKNQKAAVVNLLAAYDGVDAANYYAPPGTVIMKFMSILGEMRGINFSQNAATENTEKSSGSVTESTEGSEN